MNRTTLANIVKKLTELSQEDKKNLLKLLEEVNDGGGSSPGTNKAVSFEPQELTEEQQMQARKNQGLYRIDVIPAEEIVWDGDATGKDSFVAWRTNTVYCKIADGPLDINSRILIITEEGYDPITIKPSDWNPGGPGDLGYVYLNEGEIAILNNSSPYEADYNIISGTPPFTGIFATSKVRKIEIQEKEETVLVEPNYLTSCTVIPFTKDGNGNITCDLSTEEFISILINANQPSDVCPALNGVLGIPGYSRYRNVNDNTISFVFAFQNFGTSNGELHIDDGGDDPKIISSQSAFNLAYTLLFVFEDGSVREEDNYAVPLWSIKLD